MGFSGGEEEEEEAASPPAAAPSPAAMIGLLESRISLYQEAHKTADGQKKRRLDRALKVCFSELSLNMVPF